MCLQLSRFVEVGKRKSGELWAFDIWVLEKGWLVVDSESFGLEDFRCGSMFPFCLMFPASVVLVVAFLLISSGSMLRLVIWS